MQSWHEIHSLTRFLQFGHCNFSFSQLLMQLVWNTWKHYKDFTWLPVLSLSRQMEQITSFSFRLISAFYRSEKLSASFFFISGNFSVFSAGFSSNLYEGIEFMMSRIWSWVGKGSPSESTCSSFSSSSWYSSSGYSPSRSTSSWY